MSTRIDTRALQRITSTALSYIGLGLFAWAIYPYKWARLGIYKLRLEKAKSEARSRAAQEGKACYVIQDRMHFFVRTRTEIRREDTRIKKRFDDERKAYIKWDYRNGLVFTALPNGCERTYEPIRKTTKRKEKE